MAEQTADVAPRRRVTFSLPADHGPIDKCTMHNVPRIDPIYTPDELKVVKKWNAHQSSYEVYVFNALGLDLAAVRDNADPNFRPPNILKHAIDKPYPYAWRYPKVTDDAWLAVPVELKEEWMAHTLSKEVAPPLSKVPDIEEEDEEEEIEDFESEDYEVEANMEAGDVHQPADTDDIAGADVSAKPSRIETELQRDPAPEFLSTEPSIEASGPAIFDDAVQVEADISAELSLSRDATQQLSALPKVEEEDEGEENEEFASKNSAVDRSLKVVNAHYPANVPTEPPLVETETLVKAKNPKPKTMRRKRNHHWSHKKSSKAKKAAE